MWAGVTRLKETSRFCGGVFVAFLLAHVGHAKTEHTAPARVVHRVKSPVRHVVYHHEPVRHAPIHHVVYRHEPVHRAPVRHVVDHHVVARHIVEHRAPVRHVVYRHVEHPRVEHHVVVRHVVERRPAVRRYRYPRHLVRRTSYLWCVPYAREISHIDIKGDAFLWWAEAAGRYARGYRPEDGAVLNFRPTGRMPLGHVAVVAKVINSREILVDQANWIPDTVSRNVPVIDVSPNNNWSEVKVALGNGSFGTVYPTYGFIYNQAPSNVVYASNGGTEVAEAPVVHKIRLTAPNRTLR